MNWIKAALVIFPTGLIISGVVAMFWYVSQKQETQSRSIRYAAGLAKKINSADLERYEKIVKETQDARIIESFLESTLGPENMGYTLRKVSGEGTDATRAVAMDVELTGQQRPRDIVMVLVDPSSSPVVLSTAHAMTGEPQTRSIRFVIVENLAAVRRYYTDVIQMNDRITHILVLGALAAETDDRLVESLHLQQTGTVIERPNATATVESAQSIRTRLKELAGRF
ncbi:MAG: hypothetical protein JNJ83_12470 [Verrucomicrobiaceae bacterium]|nr:hypothetical protein [Verrucomicrobiaceae bacterium]